MGRQSESAWKRFRDSMTIGYEQWHDGIGYDLEALDDLDEKGKRDAEQILIARASNDWRDLEALDRLETPGADAAILGVRTTADPEMRLRAHVYGPRSTQDQLDDAIVYALENAEPFAGLVLALRLARENPSERVKHVLWSKVKNRCTISYHAAETLALMAGVINDEFDMTHRDLFLRMQSEESEDRQQALQEFEQLVGSQKAEY